MFSFGNDAIVRVAEKKFGNVEKIRDPESFIVGNNIKGAKTKKIF